MYKLVTAPTLAQITAFVPPSEVRYGLGMDSDSTDTDTRNDKRLVSLIQTAYYNVERYLGGRKILTQTWDYFCNSWEDHFEIDLLPLQSVTHIKYYDGDNAQQTLSSGTDYIALTDIDEVKMINTYNLYDRNDSINIRFKCGEDYNYDTDDGLIAPHPALREAIIEETFGLHYREDRSQRVNELLYDFREVV